MNPDPKQPKPGEESSLTTRDRRMKRIQEFWAVVLPLIGSEIPRWAGRSPSEAYWLHAPSEVPEAQYDLWVRQYDAGCGLTIDSRCGNPSRNKAIFDALHGKRAEIERAFGQPFEWCRLDQGKSSVVFVVSARGGYRSERREWPEVASKLIAQTRRFEATFQPYLRLVGGPGSSGWSAT